jgi:hypothetical protein
VDDVDYLMSHPALDRSVYPTTLDLFRLQPGDGALDFSNSPRVLAPGSLIKNQVFYDGGTFNPAGIPIAGLTVGDIPLSTGQFHGDGRQASHWLDDSFTNETIGAMDPTSNPGQAIEWTDADTRALGLIGWNVVSGGSITGSLFNDANANGRVDPGESGLPGVRVYIDTNRDGVFEPSEPSTLTDGLGNYLFEDLTAGDYIVRMAPQSGQIPLASSGGFVHVALAPNQAAQAPSLPIIDANTPAPWRTRDIGPIAIGGADAFSSDEFILSGNGPDIGYIGDAFHYVYQPLAGDGSIIARVDSFDASNPLAKAGIMIRESLFQNAPNILLALTHDGGMQITFRQAAGARARTLFFSPSAKWLKLTRQGDTFSAYRSLDGIHWSIMAARTIRMAKSAFAGLVINSHNTSTLATASFSNVEFDQQ